MNIHKAKLIETHYFHLPTYGLLKIEGIDAKKLLQGQLTCDVEQLTENEMIWGAHCNAKGRIISLFHLFKQTDTYYLLMPRSLLPITNAHLKKYAIFYKVVLEPIETLTNSNPHITPILNKIWPDANHEKSFKQFLIDHTIPTIYPETSELFLPHEMQLDKLNGLSFSKGCYTGQEIIARMHYLGKTKNGLYRIKIASSAQLVRGLNIYYKINDIPRVAGSVVDYLHDEENNFYYILALIDQSQVKPQHLFLNSQPNHFFDIVD